MRHQHKQWYREGQPRRERGFWFGPRGGRPFGGPFGGPPGDDPFGGEGGPRRRHKRGNIRFALLELLAEQSRHGYELIKELERRFAGFYRPSPGSVYPTLQMLEDEGFLISEQVEGKRVYTITEAGQAALAAHQAHGHGRHEFRPDTADAELGELRRSASALLDVVMQAARHGSAEQVRAVMQTLAQARRDVHRILADQTGE